MTETVNTSDTLSRIAQTVGELPASPAIVSKVMGLTSNLDAEIEEISSAISADQALTAKVLKLSNSTYFGRSKEVASLAEGIMVLGFFNVRSMVMATSAHKLFNTGPFSGLQEKLWHHSLAVAVSSRLIARKVKPGDTEEVFIAGLLHDIGKLVLLQQLTERYREIITRVEKGEGSFVELETAELGFDHCQVAAVLLNEWSFPSALPEAILFHHDIGVLVEDEPVPMAAILHLGNNLAQTFDIGFCDRPAPCLEDLASARFMQLDKETLDQIREDAEVQYQDEAKILEEV